MNVTKANIERSKDRPESTLTDQYRIWRDDHTQCWTGEEWIDADDLSNRLIEAIDDIGPDDALYAFSSLDEVGRQLDKAGIADLHTVKIIPINDRQLFVHMLAEWIVAKGYSSTIQDALHQAENTLQVWWEEVSFREACERHEEWRNRSILR